MPEKLVAKTMHGLEKVLAEELQSIGATEIEPLKRAVAFSGDKKLMYRANYELRTALRILLPIRHFQANNHEQLYGKCRDVDWANFFNVDDTFAIDAVVSSSIFRHSQYAALTLKDAIADQFRDRIGRRPNVDLVSPTVRISLKINENRCELHLDSSGESLHKRGYRRESVSAPINEVLAAGMVMLTGWRGETDFIDPMCGSGTLAIEAALLAKKVPPGSLRGSFGFMRWRDFDRKIWRTVKTEADAKAQNLDIQVFATDVEGRARNATAINAMAAGLEKDLKIDRKDFLKIDPPESSAPGLLLMNPPYDERLKMEELDEFYGAIGSRLKHNWPGWTAGIITSNREALNKIGLHPSGKWLLFNGSLECFFHKYSMYEGSKKSA